MITNAEAYTFAGSVGTVIGWHLGLVTDGTIVTGAFGGVVAGLLIGGSRLLTAWLALKGIEWTPPSSN